MNRPNGLPYLMAKIMGDNSSFINEESDNKFSDCSDDTVVTNSDINDVTKLKTELMALKMFVTDQLYILKQSVGCPTTSECNFSSKESIYINSLHDQINYLKEENKIKNSIIQSLLCHSPSKNINDKNDQAENNLPISEIAEKDNFTNDPDNLSDKDVEGDTHVDNVDNEKDEGRNKPIELKNVTKRKKKKKKKKDHSEELDNSNIKEHDKSNRHNKIDTRHASPSKTKKSVFILGDSMVKKVNGFYLMKDIKHKFLVKVRSFSSAKTRCMYDHAKPTIREVNPEHIILHVGTNDLNSEKTASQISNSIIDLANSLKNIHVSLIVPRNDNLNNKVNEVNNRLINMCEQRNIKIINQSDTIDRSRHLNESHLHLNRYGTVEFAKNFKNFLCKLD